MKFVDCLKVVEPALIVKKLPQTDVNERDYATVLFDELIGRTGVYLFQKRKALGIVVVVAPVPPEI